MHKIRMDYIFEIESLLPVDYKVESTKFTYFLSTPINFKNSFKFHYFLSIPCKFCPNFSTSISKSKYILKSDSRKFVSLNGTKRNTPMR